MAWGQIASRVRKTGPFVCRDPSWANPSCATTKRAPIEAHLAHAGAEGVGIHVEKIGSATWTFDASIGAEQRTFDVATDDVVQGRKFIAVVEGITDGFAWRTSIRHGSGDR